MSTVQSRSQKRKAVSTPTPPKAMGARKSGKGNSEICPAAVTSINADERQQLIARAAYFRAEKRGFAPGWEQQDWFEAEAEVTRLIGAS